MPHSVGLVAATSIRDRLRVHVMDMLAGVVLLTSETFEGFCTDDVRVLKSGRLVYLYEGLDDEISLGSMWLA